MRSRPSPRISSRRAEVVLHGLELVEPRSGRACGPGAAGTRRPRTRTTTTTTTTPRASGAGEPAPACRAGGRGGLGRRRRGAAAPSTSDMSGQFYGLVGAGFRPHAGCRHALRRACPTAVATVGEMPEEQPAKVTLGHLTRAERICPRRLAWSTATARANFGRQRPVAGLEPGHRGRPARPHGARRPGAGPLRGPGRGPHARAAQRSTSSPPAGTSRSSTTGRSAWSTRTRGAPTCPATSGSSARAGSAFTDADGEPEIRLLALRRPPRARRPTLADRPACGSRCCAGRTGCDGRTVRVAVADLVRGTLRGGRDRHRRGACPRSRTGSTDAARRDPRRASPTRSRSRGSSARGARSSPAARPTDEPAVSPAMSPKERLLPDILPISASSLEMWRRCPREYLNKYVLGLPESDPGSSPDFGNLVHAMLEQIHRDGSCRDAAHVEEVLALHGIDADGALAGHRRPARRALPVAGRAREARARAGALPPAAAADVHGHRPARRGLAARRAARGPRLQDRRRW